MEPGTGLGWVAFQDGDGPWQVIEGTGRTYSFLAPSGRYGVAFVCGRSGPRGEVVHATTAELLALRAFCDPGDGGPLYKVTGTLRGVPAGDKATVQLSSRDRLSATMVSSDAGSYQGQAQAGLYDLMGVAFHDMVTDRVVMRRAVTIKAEDTLDLDFQGPDSHSLIVAPLTIGGLTPEALEAIDGWVEVRTGRGSSINWRVPAPLNHVEQYPSLAAGELDPGDLQQLKLVARRSGGSKIFSRAVIRLVRSPAPLELALPPPFTAEVTKPTAAEPRLRTGFAPYDGALYYQLFAGVRGRNPGFEREWRATFTAAWLAGGTSYALPDFSGLPGFDRGWSLQAGDYLWVESTAVRSGHTVDGLVATERDPLFAAEAEFATQADMLDGTPP
ncbi:MAG TPA: hypothetical protein VN914_21060 [Polyangia bacterium]|nr:hypothetical protein [Polyangia bacterium]